MSNSSPNCVESADRSCVPGWMALEGTVRVSVTVAPNGAVKSTKTLGGNAVLAIAADQAVSQWKYEVSTRETIEAVTLVFKDNQ